MLLMLWTVWWDNIDKCSNHKATTLKVESRAPPGMVLEKEKVKEMLDNFFVNDPRQEFNQGTNSEPLFLSWAVRVSATLQKQQQQSIAHELAEPVASLEDDEADPQVEHQGEVQPATEDDESEEDDHNPTAIDEVFSQKNIIVRST